MGSGQRLGDDSVAETIADGLSSLSFDQLDDPVISRVEAAFVDTVGVGIRGARTETGEIARASVMGDGDATCWADLSTAPLTGAGFANGTAAHALDYDDVTDAIIGHASACLVPTVLAIAESEPISGSAAITAYVAGFETAAALSAPLNPAHYERGWHSTATLGAFGAAAATASAIELNSKQTANAINLTASMASGLKRNFGSMAKPMHVGIAVRSGLTAGLLAARGFDAAADPFSGPGGFFDLYRGDGDLYDAGVPVPGSGSTIESVGIDEKKYPCCYFAHGAIAAALEVGGQVEGTGREVAAVEVEASRGADDALRYPDPSTTAEARFSMEYVVAAALVDGAVDVETFLDGRLGDPMIESVRQRVAFEVDPDLPYESYETRLSVRTEDDEQYTAKKPAPPGASSNPLSPAERREKFVGNADGIIPASSIDPTYDHLAGLRDQAMAVDFLAELR